MIVLNFGDTIIPIDKVCLVEKITCGGGTTPHIKWGIKVVVLGGYASITEYGNGEERDDAFKTIIGKLGDYRG